MSDASPRMCLCCKEIFIPSPYAPQASYCSHPACRKASKKASQAKWLNQPKNRDYFTGPQHVVRVQAWREQHPGYWRRKKRRKRGRKTRPLQDSVALQDLVRSPTGVAFMGFLATLESGALQENVVRTFWKMHDRGQSILSIGL
jgi:hypothetical protein